MQFGKPPANTNATLGAAGAPAAAGDMIKDTTTAGFAKDVIEASRQVPVLVDFWAPWCGPCKQLTPVLEKVVRSYNGKVRLVKINIDEHSAIAGQLRVQSIPTVYAFLDGRPLDGFQGAIPESQLRQFIDRLVKDAGADGIEAVLEEAAKAVEAGDLQGAAEMFASVLEEDRQHVVALAGLADLYLKSGDLARAEEMIALVPPDKKDNAAVAGVRAALGLAKKAGAVAADVAPLEAKVAADPKDYQARIDLALAYAATGDKQQALEQLLEAVRRDRQWNDAAARQQLVQLFDAWGPKDPMTLEGRRRLSSILFS